MDNRIQEKPYISQNLATSTLQNHNLAYLCSRGVSYNNNNNNNVSFKGKGFKKISDAFWHGYKKLSNYMKSPSEVVNASVDAFGTGVIATAVIPISPGKGDKEDKEKKFFQAIRQPISAILKFAFQVPMTFLVWVGVDKLAYGRKIKMFKDEVIGDLIPDSKYLEKHLTKEEINNMAAEYNKPNSTLRQKHIDEIKKIYVSDGKTVTGEELNKKLSKDKDNFIARQCASAKRDKLIDEMHIDTSAIKDEDLISKEIKTYVEKAEKADAKQAKDAIKNRLDAAKKDADLKWYEKLGIKTKKVKEYKAQCEAIEKEEYVKCLKSSNPELFKNQEARAKWYKKIKATEALKRYNGKKFWISLGVNLVMVTISCYALNWLHPRIKELIDKHRHKDDAQEQDNCKKVEVNA
ncbi:MAG: hypothetical protein MJ231_05390 [bacterium]|nr:hypothetical protein [bacterium]